jgi:hypothetical protein
MIKFPNEGVIFNFLLFKIIKLKIVRLTTIHIVSTFKKKKKNIIKYRRVIFVSFE